ncbi:hypothetical protein SHKM778_87850 [Streptomyces sp. KM77-8]|uniref:Uncharacterized protein n=1 Tax=Streptomyces haneummycinicus TaxID=3074435 RepID=A0AAT9HYQ7_9ACTN
MLVLGAGRVRSGLRRARARAGLCGGGLGAGSRVGCGLRRVRAALLCGGLALDAGGVGGGRVRALVGRGSGLCGAPAPALGAGRVVVGALRGALAVAAGRVVLRGGLGAVFGPGRVGGGLRGVRAPARVVAGVLLPALAAGRVGESPALSGFAVATARPEASSASPPAGSDSRSPSSPEAPEAVSASGALSRSLPDSGSAARPPRPPEASPEAVPASRSPASAEPPEAPSASAELPEASPASAGAPGAPEGPGSSAGRTHVSTASRRRPDFPPSPEAVSPPSPEGVSSRTGSTRVAVPGPASWLTVSRGSRFPGTGPALPDVGSADDSRCFDLSGDSPATDASSMCRTLRVRQPNREPPPVTTLDSAARTMYQCPVCGLPHVVDENDIPTGSTTKWSRTLDRPM